MEVLNLFEMDCQVCLVKVHRLLTRSQNHINTLEKNTFEKNTFEKNTFEKNTFEKFDLRKFRFELSNGQTKIRFEKDSLNFPIDKQTKNLFGKHSVETFP